MSLLNHALARIFSALRSQLPARCLKLLFVVLLGMISGQAVIAASGHTASSPAVGEYKVKAAFLYHFAKFIEWPTEAGSNELVVCVLGVDPFGAALKAIAGKQVGDMQLTVRRLQRPDEMASCHMVFVSASEQPRLAGILTRLQGEQILTISDIPGFVEQGGMIMFHMEGPKLRFSVNMKAVRSTKLVISGHLLRLARRIHGNEEGRP